MEGKKILFVTHTVAMAGANSSLLRLMLELRENYGVEPVVLMPHVHPVYVSRNLFQACQKERIDCYAWRFYCFKQKQELMPLLKCLTNVCWYARVLWKLRGKTFDVVHSNGSVISLGALISRWKKIPHVWHLREFGKEDCGMSSLLGSRYERWVFGHAEVYIAISNAVKAHFAPIMPADKIRMIYNGIRPVSEEQVSRHTNPTVQFCMVGLLSESKNQQEALEAVRILASSYTADDFHLTFIGIEEQPYTDSLKTMAAASGIGEYVTFMGERSDVPFLLSQMDVGLMLSQHEAFGRVTVEYMMHGLAVVASDSGANKEIVVHGQTGFVYSLGDARALADRMAELLTDREKLATFGRLGRERALQQFTSAMNTRQVFEVYQSLK